MVTRLHQSNGYINRKLRVWLAQKLNILVGAETEFTSAGPQATPFHGAQYRAENGKMLKTSGLQIKMVRRLHLCNGYIKRKLRVWRV